MSTLKTMFQNCAACKPSQHTIRKLITFRSKQSYGRCLKHLKALGIRPFKKFAGSHTVGCHFNKQSSWEALASHPSVKLIEKDFKIRAHGATAMPVIREKRRSIPLLTSATAPALITWNVRRVKAPDAWKTTRGFPIKVAIIDTGIANHPDLRIAGGINTINGGSYADDNGHGTHVAGIAAGIGISGKVTGVAPNVKLYAVKALDQNGDGFVSDIIAGIDWCVQNGMQVINMSFGLLGSESSGMLHNAIRRAAKKGIVLVASAGNAGSSSGQIDEPASFAETIAVSASTRSNKIADFSSRGIGISITAPGVNILSTWLDGTYTKLSGTSMASPHAAGGAALLLAGQPGITRRSVRIRLRKKALKLKGYSKLAQGAGLLQLNRIFIAK